MLLNMVLKEKQVEQYNVFASLKDIKKMLRNKCFTLDRMDTRLAHVQGHIQCDLNIDAPPGSSARDLAPISSSNLE